MTIWVVPATVIRIVDADTIRCLLSLGWHVYREENCRISGVDAPERFTEAGIRASAWAAEQLPAGIPVTFTSRALDKYGRPLGAIGYGVPKQDYATALLAAGHARPYLT